MTARNHSVICGGRDLRLFELQLTIVKELEWLVTVNAITDSPPVWTFKWCFDKFNYKVFSQVTKCTEFENFLCILLMWL